MICAFACKSRRDRGEGERGKSLAKVGKWYTNLENRMRKGVCVVCVRGGGGKGGEGGGESVSDHRE